MDIQATSVQSLPLPAALVLYLGSGILLTLFYVVSVPVLIRMGLPPVWGLLIGTFLIIVPLELGFVLLQGKRLTGHLSLRGTIAYTTSLSWRTYLWLVPLTFLGAFLLPGLAVLFEPVIRTTLFGWLPPWFSAGLNQFGTYSSTIQIVTVILWLISQVVVGPVVEEFYFRGYLLPRTARGTALAPLLNAVLFAVYHFWQPYAVFTIFLFALPLAYAVWWKRNVAISIITHCTMNLIAFFSLFSGIVQR